MLDDGLYGAVALAGRLGLSIDQMMAMPYKHALLWDVAFQRAAAQKHDWA